VTTIQQELKKHRKKPQQPVAPPIATGRLAYSSAVRFAREDLATFCEIVMRDEETGEPILLQPFQEEWIDACEHNRNMVIWSHPESGKTQLMAIARILWLLGRDSRRRYAVLSATQGQSKKVIRTIQGHITSNPVVADVFPPLRRGGLWTDGAIEVMRPQGIRDPSVQAYSPEGGTMQGSRIDGLVIDDILTENNTRTRYQRDKIAEWVRATAFSRLSQDAWVVVLTNAWHPDDLAHELEKQGWWSKRYPVLIGGKSAWPERWPVERIERVRTEVLGPLEFNRQMMCRSRDESTARFKMDWITKCLERGEGYGVHSGWDDVFKRDPELAEELEFTEALLMLGGQLPSDVFTVTGVDVAVGRRRINDLTSLFTILVWPDRTRHILEVKSGRWTGPRIVDEIIGAHERWRSIVVVENNAAQDFILQWVRNKAPGLRVRSFTTGKNKLSPEYGVESLAAELAAGMWLIPCRPETLRPEREVGEWITEMLDYLPGVHTGDRLMASWIAREYARKVEQRYARRGQGAASIIG
jgi:hypothetical protein